MSGKLANATSLAANMQAMQAALEQQSLHHAASHLQTGSSNNNGSSSLSDDETDTNNFSSTQNGAHNYYSSLVAAATVAAAAAAANKDHPHHSHHHHQQHHSNRAISPMNAHHQQVNPCVTPSQQESSDNASQMDSGFLMDKNKKLFPQKLWELIHNPSIQHCLRWSEDGQRVYLNRNEFEQYYLKTPNNQFHTQKAISFVRQMNMYGFRKVDDCYYENDNFRRGKQHLLRNMIRRHPNKGLFAGLDHHQLAAAAAAQQALQVNQQLHHFEQQQKQHRAAEQALRLNSYLNAHQQHHAAAAAPTLHHPHQFGAAAAAAAAAAQAAANHHQKQQHLQHTRSSQSNYQQHQHLQQQLASSQQHSAAAAELDRTLSSHWAAAQMAAAAAAAASASTGVQHQQQNLHLNQQQQQHQSGLDQTTPAHQLANCADHSKLIDLIKSGEAHRNHNNNNNNSELNVDSDAMATKRLIHEQRLLNAAAAQANLISRRPHSLNHHRHHLSGDLHNQDSMSDASDDGAREPLSQCSSIVNSVDSAGSPRSTSPNRKSQASHNNNNNNNNNINGKLNSSSTVPSSTDTSTAAALRAVLMAGAGGDSAALSPNSMLGRLTGMNHHHRHMDSYHPHNQPTDLSSNQAASAAAAAAARDALHNTLVRSLFQFKQRNPSSTGMDLLAAGLQHGQDSQRTIIESLASLSSAGTGSIIDPASNTPTERTDTPSVTHPSPSGDEDDEQGHISRRDGHKEDEMDVDADDEDESGTERARRGSHLSSKKFNHHLIALDLASKSSPKQLDEPHNGDKQATREARTLDAGEKLRKLEVSDDTQKSSDSECARKVKRFLEEQLDVVDYQTKRIKVELSDDDCNHESKEEIETDKSIGAKESEELHKQEPERSVESLSKLLVSEICQRRKDCRLDDSALEEASCYAECFLNVLLDNASLIASKDPSDVASDEDDVDDGLAKSSSSSSGSSSRSSSEDTGSNHQDEDNQNLNNGTTTKDININTEKSCKSVDEIDVPSLSLALKLIPSKLLAAIQQQQQVNMKLSAAEKLSTATVVGKEC